MNKIFFIYTVCVHPSYTSRPNLHKSYGVLDGNVSQTLPQTWVVTGVVLRHELPRFSWLTVVRTGYQKKKHRQCQNAFVL